MTGGVGGAESERACEQNEQSRGVVLSLLCVDHCENEKWMRIPGCKYGSAEHHLARWRCVMCDTRATKLDKRCPRDTIKNSVHNPVQFFTKRMLGGGILDA